MALGYRRIGVTLVGLLLTVCCCSFAIVGQVWAPSGVTTITPNPPIAGQSFTVSTTFTTGETLFYVSTGQTCSGTTVYSTPESGSFTVTVPGLAAGQYSLTGYSGQCLDITVVPAIIPEYPYGLAFLAIFMIIGYAVIRRKIITKQK